MESLRTKYPLKRIKVFKKTLSSLVLLLITAAIVSSIILAQEGVKEIINENISLSIVSFLTWLVFFVFTVLNIIYNYFYYKLYFYDTDGKNLIIRKGVIAKGEVTLPFSRITDIYVDQDIFDRIFDLHDLHFSTATQQSAFKAHIDGLSKSDCSDIKCYVLNKINEKTS